MSQVVEGDWLPLPDPPLSGIVSFPCGVAVDAEYVYWGINSVMTGPIEPGAPVPAGTTIGRAKRVTAPVPPTASSAAATGLPASPSTARSSTGQTRPTASRPRLDRAR